MSDLACPWLVPVGLAISSATDRRIMDGPVDTTLSPGGTGGAWGIEAGVEQTVDAAMATGGGSGAGGISGTGGASPPNNVCSGKPGSIAEFALPITTAHPLFLTAGPDRALWIAEPSGDSRIVRFTMAGEITEFPIPTKGASVYGIAPGSPNTTTPASCNVRSTPSAASPLPERSRSSA